MRNEELVRMSETLSDEGADAMRIYRLEEDILLVTGYNWQFVSPFITSTNSLIEMF